MNEAFLFYAWKFRLFNKQKLETLDGEPIQIIKTGELNTDSGPDFFNARIKIGDTLWAGNIEIHLKASDWLKHGHQNDKAYTNIILHVVYENDVQIEGITNSVLELKNYIDEELWDKYKSMSENALWIPCYNHLPDLEHIVIYNCQDRMMIEKLEHKTSLILTQLENSCFNWDEVLYRELAASFGFRVNSSPFRLLANSIPLQILLKHRNHSVVVEAILFGQSGLLANYSGDEEYPITLIKEYKYWSKIYNLIPIDAHLWKFLRLRPVNFPGVRIAQFSRIICKSSNLFSKIINCENLNELEEIFKITVSEYWNTHFVFSKPSKPMTKKLGIASVQNIIINTIVPFLFVYGKHKKEEKYCKKALEILKQLPPESNTTVKKWSDAGIKAQNAFDSQSLLFLSEQYCFQKKCLSCGIGKNILKK